MSPATREKIALGLLTALIVLSLCGLGWYLIAGHSWNVAASNIDDTVGTMEGYTAIVYEGTAKPQLENERPSAAAKGSDAKEDGASGATVLNIADSSINGGAGDSGSDGSGERSSGGKDSKDDAGSAANDVSATKDDPATSKDDASGDVASDASGSAASGNPVDASSGLDGSDSNATSSTLDPDAPAVTASSVAESYRSKQAAVLELDLSDPARYAEGTIVKRGSHRFGVLSLDAKTPRAQVVTAVFALKRAHVNYVVAIAPSTALLDGVEGVDIAIGTNSLDPSTLGSSEGGLFAVDAPVIGRVGTILISPSNVVSAKVAGSI